MSFVKKKSLSIFFWDKKTRKPLPSPFFISKDVTPLVGWLQPLMLGWLEPRRAAFHPLGVAGYFGWLDRIFRSTYQRTRQPTCGSNLMTRKSLFETNSWDFWVTRKQNLFFFHLLFTFIFFKIKCLRYFCFFHIHWEEMRCVFFLGGCCCCFFWTVICDVPFV